MAIVMPPQFETALIAACGWDANLIDPGSSQIDLLNIGGQTTVRATVVAQIDTKVILNFLRTELAGN